VNAAAAVDPVDAIPRTTDEIAVYLRNKLPTSPTPMSALTGLLPDETLDELEVGMREIVMSRPDLFAIATAPNGSAGVVPVRDSKLPPPEAFEVEVADKLDAAGGAMPVGTLAAVLSPAAQVVLRTYSSPSEAIRLMPHVASIAKKSKLVTLDPAKHAEVAHRRNMKVRGHLRQVPSFVVPLRAVAELQDETPRETFAWAAKSIDYIDLVCKGGRSGGGSSDDLPPAGTPEEEAFIDSCYLRVLPPFHGACDPDACHALDPYRVEDFDAHRLARFLTTDSPVPVVQLEETAAGVLSKAVRNVIHAFPELFEYNEAEDTCRFILLDSFRPSPMLMHTDEQLLEQIAKCREAMRRGNAGRKFDKQAAKDKLIKYQNAQMIRANPAGSVCMDENVFAMLIYDILPAAGSVSSSQISEMLPEFARSTTLRLSRRWLVKFPHLFTVYQQRPPDYLIQRADVPLGDDVLKTTPDGVPFQQLDVAAIADEVIRVARDMPFEGFRPTRFATIAMRLPYLLRQHMKQVGAGITALCEARPESIQRVRVDASDDRWIMFIGEVGKKLPPNSRGKMKVAVFDAVTGDLVMPAATPEELAAQDAEYVALRAKSAAALAASQQSSAQPKTAADASKPASSSGRGWDAPSSADA
jgi:hypothetical protein